MFYKRSFDGCSGEMKILKCSLCYLTKISHFVIIDSTFGLLEKTVKHYKISAFRYIIFAQFIPQFLNFLRFFYDFCSTKIARSRITKAYWVKNCNFGWHLIKNIQKNHFTISRKLSNEILDYSSLWPGKQAKIEPVELEYKYKLPICLLICVWNKSQKYFTLESFNRSQ